LGGFCIVNAPIYNALVTHNKKLMSSFHTPGHKGVFFKSFDNLFNLDLTELNDTDDLYSARGCIDKAQKLASDYFGAQKTLFSTSGNTLCIQAMLKIATEGQAKIICARNIHKSALGAIVLLGLDVVWVFPKYDAGPGLFGRISPEDIKKAIIKNPDSKAVYITSPDYYGLICDVEKISHYCKSKNISLLVDNAHGTHLACFEPSLHPIALGADICSDSAHKTLPVLTSGAFLNINNKSYLDNATESMALFGSTSPSFPILASLDLCRNWMKNEGNVAFSILKKRVDRIKNLAEKIGIILPRGQIDPIRISLGVGSIGFSPNECAEIFRKFGVESEFASDFYLTLIPSPLNTHKDFERLESAILSLKRKKSINYNFESFAPEKKLFPREAFFAKNKRVCIQDSVGKISARGVCPCPPGFLFVAPGEKITHELAFYLKKLGVIDLLVVD
jgi:arginine/lysine/ornithine decarboxylase